MGRRALPLPPVALVTALALAASSPGSAPATPAAPPPASAASASVAPPFPAPAPSSSSDAASRAAAAETARLDAEARAPATDVRIAPSMARGVIGAWLVAGPFKAGRPALDALPVGVTGIDEAALAASSGATLGSERDFGGGPTRKKPAARWMITSSNDGPVDLKAAI